MPVSNISAIPAFENKLAAVDNVTVRQGRWLLEFATCGIIPNVYMISDNQNTCQPQGAPAPEPYPMFTIQEQGGACFSRDCCCRCWCNPNHPSLLKFYDSGEPKWEPPKNMCVCEIPGYVTAEPLKENGAFLTMERLGCCSRWANCWVCCELCQDEVRIHNGDVGEAGDAGTEAMTTDGIQFTARVPIGGGGCTPTVNVYPGFVEKDDENIKPKFVVEGPTFFGGCYDLCADTYWTVSKQPGMSGDVARITKLKPEGCTEICKQVCSTADNYRVEITDKSLSATEKGMVMTEVVHLDYMFFEANQDLCHVEVEDDHVCITVLFCLCYCHGCLCPVQGCLYIPTKGN